MTTDVDAPTPDPSVLLYYSALRKSAADPSLVGHWLDRHRTTERLTADELALALGTDLRRLALLALCLAPRPEAFAEDVGVAAGRAGIDPARLAAVLRQEQSLAAWAAGTAPPNEAGWLLAAHDADPQSPERARRSARPDEPRG